MDCGDLLVAQPLDNGWVRVSRVEKLGKSGGFVASGEQAVGYALIDGRSVGISARLLLPLDKLLRLEPLIMPPRAIEEAPMRKAAPARKASSLWTVPSSVCVRSCACAFAFVCVCACSCVLVYEYTCVRACVRACVRVLVVRA